MDKKNSSGPFFVEFIFVQWCRSPVLSAPAAGLNSLSQSNYQGCFSVLENSKTDQ